MERMFYLAEIIGSLDKVCTGLAIVFFIAMVIGWVGRAISNSSCDYYTDKDYNDSYYDITNAIMGKDVSTFKTIDKSNDTRITKVKTTKGTKGFGRNTIAYAVNSKDLPIFDKFFDARDVLAKKINKQLVEQGLLLWERENIY